MSLPSTRRILFSSMLAQRHKPYWGEDAHIFDPDRFLDDRVKKYVTPNPFVFIPFSAGPRIVRLTYILSITSYIYISQQCLGQQFAYHEASFFVIRMLQRYDRIALAPECLSADSRPPVSWQSSKAGTPRKAMEQCVLNSHLTLFVKVCAAWFAFGTQLTFSDCRVDYGLEWG